MTITRILIVEDEPHASSVLKSALGRRGPFHIREENDSTRAVATARSYRPDLIVLDVDLPWKDGCDVAMEIGFDPVLRAVPIVRFSTPTREQAAASRGGAVPLAKPLNPNRLIDVITAALMEQTALRASS
jgi:CheY-like chemotaxis protein